MGEQLRRGTTERAPEASDEEIQRAAGSVAVKEARDKAEAAGTLEDEIDELLSNNVDEDDIQRTLDEIDLVLEPNAEEFVRQYRQRGGQ